jgi:hypothetical protein
LRPELLRGETGAADRAKRPLFKCALPALSHFFGASIAGSYRIDCKLAFHFEPFFRFTGANSNY